MKDEIVEEVREARAMLAARFDYDISRIHAWARQVEQEHADKLLVQVGPSTVAAVSVPPPFPASAHSGSRPNSVR